jgi:hypothetical protein
VIHDLQVDSQPLEKRAVELARRIQADLHDHCVRPTPTLDPEPYTLFCIDELPVSPDRKGMTAEQWLTDDLENITKFFGDWHLARIYRTLSDRFHLAEWHRILDNKLKTLGDLYQILQQDRNNFWMVVLETTIVLLFILDLILLLMGK